MSSRNPKWRRAENWKTKIGDNKTQLQISKLLSLVFKLSSELKQTKPCNSFFARGSHDRLLKRINSKTGFELHV